MLRALAVRPLDDGIVEGGVDDRRLQVIEHDAADDTAEPLKGAAMTAQPGVDLLVEHELRVAVPTERECHHKHPGFAQRLGVRIAQQTRVAKVHLRFLRAARSHPHVRFRRPRLQVTHKAIDRTVAPRKRVLLPKNVVNRPTLHAALSQGHDLVAEWRHFRGDRRRRTRRQRGLQLRLQRGRIRQRRRQHVVLLRPPPVLPHRLATHLQVTSDLAIGLVELQASYQLTNFQHVRSPSRQGPLRPLLPKGPSSTRRRGEQQEQGVAPIGRKRLAPNRVKTGGPLSSDNGWPPMGENEWPTIGRQLTERRPPAQRCSCAYE